MPYQFQPEFVTGLRCVTHCSYPVGYQIGWHQHGPQNGYELIYVDSGQITLEMKKGSTFYLHAGICFFIPSFTVHRLANRHNAPADYLNIMFYGTLPGELCLHPRLVKRQCHRLASSLREESREQRKYYEESCCCLLTRFIIALLREDSQDFALSRPAFFDNFQSERAEKIFDILSREYRTITFEDLAVRMNVSRSTLYLIFRDELGGSFSQFVEHCRFEQASYLLKKSVFSLSEIAAEVGCNGSTFFRLFKKKTGMTPSQFALTLK